MSELSAFADFISKFGWLAVSILIIAAWMLGIFHSDREVKTSLVERDKALAERDKRYDEMKGDRDEWKRTANEAVTSLRQLTGVMEAAQTARRANR